MASIADASRLSAAAALLCCAGLASAPSVLTLEQAASRRPGTFAPARQGEAAVVRGRVNSRPISILGQFYHAGIEAGGRGLMLEWSGRPPYQVTPGDEVEATGRIGTRAGLPVLEVSGIRVLGRGPAPAPVPVEVDELTGFHHLGRLVEVEGRILEVGENIAGAYILIGRSRDPYKIFLPHSPDYRDASFAGYAVGDTIRAVGIASQYCAGPPYNRWFQLTVARATDVRRTGHPLALPPGLIASATLALAIFGLFWWARDRRLRSQREALRRFHELGEEILGASSPQDIARKIAAALPKAFAITRAEIYVYAAGTRSLDRLTEAEDEDPVSIPLVAPLVGTAAGAAACFQNRVLLAVPDTSRSPFPPPGPGKPPMPRSVLFVPMFAQGEAVGVFEIRSDERARDFPHDEQALAQHLANQIGVALRLLDQRSVREQLFRTEKLAAVGRLITGVVNELQAPLASIRNAADIALASCRPETCGELKTISAESRKASDIVARLVSFASSEPVVARAVDLNHVLRHLGEFREREWKARGIRVRLVMTDEPLNVLGSEGQLEQVFLDLIVHAEQALADATEKLITLRTMRVARKALVDISYSAPENTPAPDTGAAALGFGICRSVIAGHGGELRVVAGPGAAPHFEIEMPRFRRDRQVGAARDTQPRESSQPLTALMIEADEAVERHLLALLSARGYRVVPVRNSDVGLELAQRLSFDIAFCSVRAPGLNWVELSERLEARVAVFVLLSDGYDPELAADFEGANRFVLAKPIDEARLNQVLRRVEGDLQARSAVM